MLYTKLPFIGAEEAEVTLLNGFQIKQEHLNEMLLCAENEKSDLYVFKNVFVLYFETTMKCFGRNFEGCQQFEYTFFTLEY